MVLPQCGRTLRGPIRSPRGDGYYSSPARDIPSVGGPSVVRTGERQGVSLPLTPYRCFRMEFGIWNRLESIQHVVDHAPILCRSGPGRY